MEETQQPFIVKQICFTRIPADEDMGRKRLRKVIFIIFLCSNKQSVIKQERIPPR